MKDKYMTVSVEKTLDMFPVGSVVYFIKDEVQRVGDRYTVVFGIVESHISRSVVEVEMYDFCENRTVDGIPVQNIEFPTMWRKLPRGWTIGDPLWEFGSIDRAEQFPEAVHLSIHKPEDILKAIEIGLLVKVKDKSYYSLETELGSKTGWRIVQKWMPKVPPRYKTAYVWNLYPTYEEAKAVVEDIHREWERQAALSDEEWSIEEIDRTLDRWAACCAIPIETQLRYREWLLSLDNIEDVVTRVYMSEIQWKYDHNRRWHSIVLPIQV